VLQSPYAQNQLIEFLGELIDAMRWDLFFSILYRRIKGDSDWDEHPIRRSLKASPSHGREFREKTRDRLPDEPLTMLRAYRYRINRWHSVFTDDFSLLNGLLFSWS
jgi:hypothetical protein